MAGKRHNPEWITITMRNTWPPIHRAADDGDYAKVKALLDNGEDPNRRLRPPSFKLSPLHLAVEKRHRNVARLLIARGADINALSDSNESPLCYAARVRDIKTVKILLDAGANPDLPESMQLPGRTPLCAAIAQGDLEMMRVLIDRGAHVSVGTVNYCNSVQTIGFGRASHDEMMDLLKEYAPDIVMDYWMQNRGNVPGRRP